MGILGRNHGRTEHICMVFFVIPRSLYNVAACQIPPLGKENSHEFGWHGGRRKTVEREIPPLDAAFWDNFFLGQA